MSQHFSLVEVEDAEFYAGDLFRRVFGAPIPDYPRHLVCLYQSAPGVLRTAGYAHFSVFESFHLIGGLMVDKSLYPSIPKEHLAELQADNSIAQFILREAIPLLGKATAIFAYTGDARSRELNFRVGYVATHLEKLYAYWQVDLPEAVKRAAAERVMKIAPF